MQNTIAQVPVFDKTKILYGIIGVLILALFGKGLFASDEETMRDSLTKIDSKVSYIQKYKEDKAREIQIEVDRVNKEISETCSSIPESVKSAVDCSKFQQTYEIKIGTSTGGTAPVPEQSGTVDEPTLREALKLKDCVVSNQKHKFPADSIEFQAIDIRCKKGEAFAVYTPNWKDEYIITSIGYGTNLGNYVVLRSGDYHFVYGHTVADKQLKVGDRLGKNKTIGVTNISGASSGMHMHFELWEGGQNINGRFMVGDKIIYSPDSQKLLDKRGWDWGAKAQDKKYWQAYSTAIDLLHSEEGLRLKAYPDYKGCSIGYGSRANSCDEVITVAEANKRLAYVVRDLTGRVQEHFPQLSSTGQAALISFAYNCHAGYVDVVKNGLQQHSKWCKYVTVDGEKKYLDSLKARRDKEAKMLKE